MNILIINPNSSEKMTNSIFGIAKQFANGDFRVDCMPTPDASQFIETYEDEIKAAPGMVQVVQENENKYDGFVIACHYDPHLDMMKEISSKPVVGIGEASMKIASMLGHRFSIITTDDHSIPIHEDLVYKYHLENYVASIRAPLDQDENLLEPERYLKVAQRAITEEMAEVIVLGCAGLAGLDKTIQKKLGVPVLDGVVCALMIITGLVKYRVTTSKIRKYKNIWN